MQQANLEMRKIKSLNFLYEISSDGRILRNIKSKKTLKQRKSSNGYWLVTVCLKGVKQDRTIHSLVAECWLGDCPDQCEIDHIDRNKNNNHFSNLRYVTHSDNNKNRAMHWKHPITLISTQGEKKKFSSTKDAVNFLLTLYPNKTFSQIRWKFSNKRKHIYEFDVIYHSLQRLDTPTLRSKE